MVQYTQPPLYHMPPTGELIYLLFAGAAAALIALYAGYLAVTRRTVFPLLICVGAFLTVLLEAPADVLGNAVHSQLGQRNAFTVRGAPVPWGVVLTYGFYAATLPVALFDRIRAQSLSPRFWWGAYVASLLAVCAIEQIPVHYGLWHYFGYQPFKIWEMPVSMVFANAACVVVPALLVYKLYPVLTGWRQLLVIGLIPSGTMAGWAAASLAIMNALGTDTEANHGVVQLASIATVGLSLLVTWAAITIVHWPANVLTGVADASDQGLRLRPVKTAAS
ncbi:MULTISPECIES: hypothetical protein [Mycobacterium]|uniref:Uncharacterized protein n=1 Tax=Mycobacterium kiyosense TaxID=2871094 RepID=A0A9P3Q4T5_9MYCO|nr:MULTISPECIES: hypothetical protein [Mycobacterium]BDB44132.1 hypothetical protein IWGMT90018_45780 [Mycobacterium kiyosense]BDE15664.1 hypothetical protein MKCMC460_45240 [Mycobacterium sp. 20KCMC460]GLB80913.1 hypothetical protein SRL2020028_01690 [Mycobacterium kiyosense]GLB87327.1 hypothetical protein SRL2020130_01440 [Mycobacterium kiyosense]GLB93393.1 hypothetical protein SRL2020226_01690 [Mycobacterium kiyosense]